MEDLPIEEATKRRKKNDGLSLEIKTLLWNLPCVLEKGKIGFFVDFRQTGTFSQRSSFKMQAEVFLHEESKHWETETDCKSLQNRNRPKTSLKSIHWFYQMNRGNVKQQSKKVSTSKGFNYGLAPSFLTDFYVVVVQHFSLSFWTWMDSRFLVGFFYHACIHRFIL